MTFQTEAAQFDSGEAERRGGSRSEPSRRESSPESRPPDPEVVAKASRRRFSAQYKLRILEEAECCSGQGEIGLLLRREGLRSSHLANWRKARREGSLARLNRRRGPKPRISAEQKRIVQLERKVYRLEADLETAHTILEVQGKVARLLGLNASDEKSSS